MKLTLILAILVSAPCFARGRVFGNCEQGGTTVSVSVASGIYVGASATPVQKSYPGCTVTVYSTGTTTTAPIYSDNSSTALANPFTASQTGFWFFYANNGRYDVKFSGGGIGVPFTLGDQSAFDINDQGALNPLQFGAKFDGSTDDTAAWQATINTAILQQRSITCPSQAISVVSKQGVTTFAFDGLTHPYVFLIASPLTISGYCTLQASMTDANTANVFVFQGTQHVRVSGLTFNGTGGQVTQSLYNGAGVVFEHCNDCYGFDLKSFNMRGNLLAFQSGDVGCSHCFASGSVTGKQGAHWGAYSCVGAVFSENTGYGGTTDGDISLFGYQASTPAVGNKALNNHLYNYAYGDTGKAIANTNNQGILADSGQTGELISGNYVYGYYYCIDVKTQSNGTIVSNNTTEKCKVGIAVRLGETPIMSQSVIVTGNSIRPLGGNGNVVSFNGLTATLGIWIQDSFGVVVTNNVIEASWLFGSGAQDFIPIYAQISSVTSYYPSTFFPADTNPENSVFSDGIDISHNIIALQQQQGATYTYSANSVIVVAGLAGNIFPRVRIDQNDIKFRVDGAIASTPIAVSYARNVSISGNSFGFQSGSSGLYSITCSTCFLLSVNNNRLDHFGGFLSVTSSNIISVSGNIGWQQTRDLAAVPMPFISSNASTNWTIIGNQRHQPAGNVDNGRFFDTAGSGTTGVVIGKNIMDQEIFEQDWYSINGTPGANTSDISVLDNVRLGPLDGTVRTLMGVSPAIGGSPVTGGTCTGANVTTIHGVYPGMFADVYPTNSAGPGQKFFYYGTVTALNTVVVNVCATVTGTPTSMTYAVRVRQ